MASSFSLLLLLFIGCHGNEDDDIEKTYRFNETIQVGGIARSYTVNLPPNYYKSSAFSLVIGLHGGGGSASQFENSTKLTDKANSVNFIVVYPDGTGVLKTWNAGECCGYAMNNDVDDVNFISKLIDKLIDTYKINPEKVYVTGHSNGGMMSYRLACELSAKIAAIAPNSCTQVITGCNPSRPVPILHMHSKLDENIPYLGGTGSGVTGVYCTPIDDVLNSWSARNECTSLKQLTHDEDLYSFYQWTGCTSSRIDYYLTEDGGHAWPGGLPGGGPDPDAPSVAINANDLLWDFFQQFPLP